MDNFYKKEHLIYNYLNMLDINNFKADNTAQNIYFKKLLDMLKDLLNKLTFENICDNDKLITNEHFIKEFDTWFYKYKLNDKNNRFIYKIKFLNVQTATSKAKIGFINSLLNNYCVKISSHLVKSKGISSYKYFIEPIKNIDEIIEYRIKSGKTFKGIEKFKTYSEFKYSEFFTEPTNNNNNEFIDDKDHNKNNICNDDESDDEDYEYVKNGVKVSRDEYYNKKIITDDKNISICNNEENDNCEFIDTEEDNNNIVCNNELINDGFIDDEENNNSEFIDIEEYNNNELINDGFIDSEDEKDIYNDGFIDDE